MLLQLFLDNFSHLKETVGEKRKCCWHRFFRPHICIQSVRASTSINTVFNMSKWFYVTVYLTIVKLKDETTSLWFWFYCTDIVVAKASLLH